VLFILFFMPVIRSWSFHSDKIKSCLSSRCRRRI